MTRKKVVNDDLFKRKFVVVNFWCFLQSWCIRLEKNLFKLTKIFRDACQSQKYCQKSDMAIFCCVNIGKPKKRCVFIVVNFAFSTIDCKNAFSLHWSSKLFCTVLKLISENAKKSFWYLKVGAGRKSSSSAVDRGKWASSSRFKIANS